MFENEVDKALTSALQLANNNEEMVVDAVASKNFEAATHSGVLDQCESSESVAFGVQIVKDGKIGFAKASSLELETIQKVVELARQNLEFSSYDENIYLPTDLEIEESNAKAQGEVENNLADANFHNIDTEKKLSMIMELDAKSENNTSVDCVMQSGYEDLIYTSGFAALGKSLNQKIISTETSYSIGQYLSAKAEEGKAPGTGGAFISRRNFLDLEKYLTLSDQAIFDALLTNEAQIIDTANHSVIFHQEVVAGILSTVVSMCNPDFAIKNSSLVQNKVGESIAKSNVSIFDDPTNTNSRGYTPYDADGLRTTKNFLLKDGIFQQFLCNAKDSRELGQPVNSCAIGGVGSASHSGAHNLFFVDAGLNGFGENHLYQYKKDEFESNSEPLQQLFSTLDNGLFVTEVSGWHSGVNAQTGSFSLGAKGVVIKGGQISQPFSEVTISTTIFELLNNIVEFGKDYTERNSGAVLSSLLVENIQVTGK